MNDHNDLQAWLSFDDLDVEREERASRALRSMVEPLPSIGDVEAYDMDNDLLGDDSGMTFAEACEEASNVKLDVARWVLDR